MQIGDFRQDQVFTPQEYDEFRFGMGVVRGKGEKSIAINGAYTYEPWNTPTWHERLKPAYYELQAYLKHYRETEQEAVTTEPADTAGMK